MQKQHLHGLLLILGAVLGLGCGPKELPQLNPYLHGNQEFEFDLTGTDSRTVEVGGWHVYVEPAIRGGYSGLQIESQSGQDFQLAWCYGESSEDRVIFTRLARTLDGFVLEHPELTLKCEFAVRRDGRECALTLDGESSREITLLVEAETFEHSIFVNDRAIDAPRFVRCGDTVRQAVIRLHATASQEPATTRGLEVATESDEVNRSISLLTTLVPHAPKPELPDSISVEGWAELAEAQWICYGEAPDAIRKLLESDETELAAIKFGLPGLRAILEWGTYPIGTCTALRDKAAIAVASKLDRHDLKPYSSPSQFAARLREAGIFLFGERYLAGEVVGANRSLFREETSRAVNDVQRELKRRSEERTGALTPQAILDEREFLGSDSVPEDPRLYEEMDSVSIFDAASWGNLTWLYACGDSWRDDLELPWELDEARLRHRFNQDPTLRETPHWSVTVAALHDDLHRGLLMGDGATREEHWAACASEIQTLTRCYLGIQPNRQQNGLTLDPRLPKDWGRTRARVPYSSGDLYVDYDFARQSAVVAYHGISEELSCLLYFPLPSGRSMPGQFVLTPEATTKRITLSLKSGSEFRLNFDDAGIPE